MLLGSSRFLKIIRNSKVVNTKLFGDHEADSQTVSTQFRRQWKHPTKRKSVKHVYLVVAGSQQLLDYEIYKTWTQFFSCVNASKVESRLWHGTTRRCLLGERGNTRLCQDLDCGVCGIITTSFDIAFCGTNKGWGRFGRHLSSLEKKAEVETGTGIYTSATSSKAASYSVRYGYGTVKISALTSMLSKCVV